MLVSTIHTACKDRRTIEGIQLPGVRTEKAREMISLRRASTYVWIHNDATAVDVTIETLPLSRLSFYIRILSSQCVVGMKISIVGSSHQWKGCTGRCCLFHLNILSISMEWSTRYIRISCEFECKTKCCGTKLARVECFRLEVCFENLN